MISLKLATISFVGNSRLKPVFLIGMFDINFKLHCQMPNVFEEFLIYHYGGGQIYKLFIYCLVSIG